MNSDTITTATGLVLAAATAAIPILTKGGFDVKNTGDWVSLGAAIALAVHGYYTNKPSTQKKLAPNAIQLSN